MPDIVYLQTITACNGHCRYCPFDDVYGDSAPYMMDAETFNIIIGWLRMNHYAGRIGFLLHCEPTLDPDLQWRVEQIRKWLPMVSVEIATNGIEKMDPSLFDRVDRVAAGSKKFATSRAGNVRACPEILGRQKLENPPCPVPRQTMPIAANGSVLLCCQDWRHESVCGTIDDLTEARRNQLVNSEKASRLEFEICRDCMAGKTAEEVGERLGKRTL